MPRKDTNVKRFNGPGKGRPKGVKEAIPRSAKASVKKIIEDLVGLEPEMVRAAFKAGLEAKPPYSFPYVQLGAHYIDGKPSDKIEQDVSVEFRWKNPDENAE